MPKVATGERFLTPQGALLVARLRGQVTSYLLVGFDVAAISARWLRHEVAQLTRLAALTLVRLVVAGRRVGGLAAVQLVDVLTIIGWLIVGVSAAALVTCIDVLTWLSRAGWQLLRSAARTAADAAHATAHNAAHRAKTVPQRSTALFDRTGHLVSLRRGQIPMIDLRVPAQQAGSLATPVHGISTRARSESEHQPQPALAD